MTALELEQLISGTTTKTTIETPTNSIIVASQAPPAVTAADSLAKAVDFLLKPDLATPPQSPLTPSVTTSSSSLAPHRIQLIHSLVSNQSLTSSTSSINSIDNDINGVNESSVMHSCNSNHGDQTNVEAEAMMLPSESQSRDLVLSILDDLIANDVLTEKPEPKNEEITAEGLQELKAKIQKKNETLRETLKASYNRLRQIQTKCFQSHVAQQLTNILDLKQKQKMAASSQPCLSNTVESLGASVVKVTENNKPIISPTESASVIDDTSVDLLTSILKSNLSDTKTPESVASNGITPVDAAVKSLLDDIQYEILKQSDDNKSSHKKQKSGSDTESDTEDEADETDNWSSSRWPLVVDTTTKTSPTPQQQHGVVGTAEVKTEKSELSADRNDDAQGKLTDSSNLFWSKSRVQLGSEWTRVQTKLKQLKSKSKQCTDYMDKRQAVLDKFNSQKPTRTTTTPAETLAKKEADPAETTRSDQAAIAALSTSLQESVAAEVFATTTSQQAEPTASRCMPYNRSAVNWYSSRLYNLNRSDLVELDDDVLRSFYFTLRYFGNTYFKTMCMCRNAGGTNISSCERERGASNTATAARNRNNYYFQKKRRSLMQLQEQLNSSEVAGTEGGEEAQESSLKAAQMSAAAELLTVQGKTCIFCHLIKKYEQARMVENITATTDSLLSNANSKQARSVKVTSAAAKSKKKQQQQQLELMKHRGKGQDQSNAQFLSTPYKSDGNDAGILADLNIVNRDHSYCKQSSSRKNLLVNSSDVADLTQQDVKQMSAGETKAGEELIDKLVGDRLNRIFDGVIVNSVKTEETTIEVTRTNGVEDAKPNEEELIDAGFDLTPDDLQKLPDLSYEELKFLNEIELDKNTYRKKFDFVNDSLDLSCENNAYTRDYTSFLSSHNNTNSAYPMPSQLTAEIFQALSYRPKYRNLLNKKRREHKQQELSELKKVESASYKKQRERALTAKMNKLAESKDRAALDKKSTRALSVRPRKRQRSTSSYSSNSSIVSSSFNDSNCGESTGSNSSPVNHSHNRSGTTYFNYYSGSNKYDIDNIVIPFDSSCSAGLKSTELAEKLKQSNVLTPKWRENQLEPMINITDDVPERLDDEYFEQLHAQKELRNRFNNGKKLKLSPGQQALSASMPASLLTSCLSSDSGSRKKTPVSPKLNEVITDDRLSSSLNLSKQQQWPGRKFPLSDYEYEIMTEHDQMQQQPSNCT